MKIPKAFHPILGLLFGFILFLGSIAILSALFVATYKAIDYAKPYILEVASYIINRYHLLFEWLVQ